MYLIGTSLVPPTSLSDRDRELLRGWLDFEQELAFSTKRQPQKTKLKLRALGRLLGHTQRTEKTLGSLDNEIESLREREKLLRAEGDSRTFLAGSGVHPSVVRTHPAEWGDRERTESLFTATRISRVLWPETNSYAFWRDQLTLKALTGSPKAIIKRVKEFEKRLLFDRKQPEGTIGFTAEDVLRQRFDRFTFLGRVSPKKRTLVSRTLNHLQLLAIPNAKKQILERSSRNNVASMQNLMQPTTWENLLLKKLADDSAALFVRTRCSQCQNVFWVQNTGRGKKRSRCSSCSQGPVLHASPK